jgi:hypothetical protein
MSGQESLGIARNVLAGRLHWLVSQDILEPVPCDSRPDRSEYRIRKWIHEWNNNPRPFVWTKTADEILDTLAAYCALINDSGH